MSKPFDAKKIKYIRFCGVPVAGTLTGPMGTSEWVRKGKNWVRI